MGCGFDAYGQGKSCSSLKPGPSSPRASGPRHTPSTPTPISGWNWFLGLSCGLGLNHRSHGCLMHCPTLLQRIPLVCTAYPW